MSFRRFGQHYSNGDAKGATASLLLRRTVCSGYSSASGKSSCRGKQTYSRVPSQQTFTKEQTPDHSGNLGIRLFVCRRVREQVAIGTGKAKAPRGSAAPS